MVRWFRLSIIKTKQAFTLAELSIVLLIIGLITGSILVGGNLVKQGRIVAVIAEVQQYLNAINNFQAQYGALPGDIENASTFWPNCTSASGDGGNCNGNGDGIIGYLGQGWWDGSNYNNNEFLRAWQHMSLAGMIPGSYTGFGVSSTNGSTIGVNTPASRYPNASYSFWADSCFYRIANYSALILGGLTGTFLTGVNASPIAANGVMNPADAYDLDVKMDDGLPMTGKVYGRDSLGASACEATASTTACGNASSNTYVIQNSTVGCQMQFQYQHHVVGAY